MSDTALFICCLIAFLAGVEVRRPLVLRYSRQLMRLQRELHQARRENNRLKRKYE